MSTTLMHQLRRLKRMQPQQREEAVLLLDDVVTLRRRLVAARDAAGLELQKLRRNADAAHAYENVMKGKAK